MRDHDDIGVGHGGPPIIGEVSLDDRDVGVEIAQDRGIGDLP
jgi:hypothetical protein